VTSSPRPRVLAIVAGTGTEVGKTTVACALARELRVQGLAVAARKPAQSFEPAATQPGTTDAELLAAATGESPSDVCPPERWYAKPMAPPMAATALGRQAFYLRDLEAALNWPRGRDVGLVELAGGLGSPQAADGDGVDLAGLLAPDLVVLVAGAGLGTLSPISLSARALGKQAKHGLVVYLNRFDGADELHSANKRWLVERQGLAVCTGVGELAGLFARLLGKGAG